MTKSKRVMRRLILSRLYDSLQDQDSVLYSREQFVNGELPIHEIDALLAFKSDPHLEDLRLSLERLERGTYGVCISCKDLISQEVLDSDPTQRMCTGCERSFIHVATHQYYHEVAPQCR